MIRVRVPTSPMHSPLVYRLVAFGVAALLVVACAPQPPPLRPPPPGYPVGFPTAFYAAQPAYQVYRIASGDSSVVVKVYRAGALASFGHNHVIASRAVDGFVFLADDLNDARADLFVPVDSFVVDDAALRASAGPDFALQPTTADIDGTRANLLGQKLLDAANHPYIVVHVSPTHVGPQSTRVDVELRVRDHVAVVPVDVVWQRDGESLHADANFAVTHTALGLEPFAAVGGALRVADKIELTVALTAHATAAATAPASK